MRLEHVFESCRVVALSWVRTNCHGQRNEEQKV